MNKGDSITAFDWQRIFSPENIPTGYFAEIALRTVVMFLVLIIALKFLSKRGVKQLSVFELAILIALGSATGDPMFYSYIPLTYGVIVLFMVIVLYRVITRLTGKSKTLEVILEGKPICLLKDGCIEYVRYRKVGLPYDKFFSELRLKGIDHLGQVHKVYLETSGELSIYMFPDEAVRAGLPIYPELLDAPLQMIPEAAEYACVNCGCVEHLPPGKHKCTHCANEDWLLSQSNHRVV